ncbi:hypothetical protein BDM02DRAFT_1499067 [Thelephora ganbajun]|uniref:Uncharacterized protein n=1 Tax=Thelephora ganbajun TaxID=370292 RepID=A0ACB6ZLI0_THEGA|nr:hypothetical protein BDM02DRAFT_1499067 [Thelephora ganbajun]
MVRFKNRWILVEFLPLPYPNRQSTALNSKQIYAALKQSVIVNFGDAGWGAVGNSLNVKYFSPATNICIIRVARDPYRIAWGAVTCLSSMDGQKYIPNVVHVSGTIKHAQLAAIKHNREVIARYRARSEIGANSYEEYLTKSTAEIESLQD